MGLFEGEFALHLYAVLHVELHDRKSVGLAHELHEDMVGPFCEVLGSFGSITCLRLGAIHHHHVLPLKAWAESGWKFQQRCLYFLAHFAIMESLEGTGLLEYLRRLKASWVYLQID